LTANAADKLGGIMDQKGLRESHALRVFVKGGQSCRRNAVRHDLRRKRAMATKNVEMHGLRIIVDPTSLFYINGASIDYVDNLMGGGFHIDNPQATSSCGCGSSFRTAKSHTGEAVPESCGHHHN
jgi:iron-sulfur cluster assembly protein